MFGATLVSEPPASSTHRIQTRCAQEPHHCRGGRIPAKIAVRRLSRYDCAHWTEAARPERQFDNVLFVNRTVSAVFFPYTQYQSLLPYTGCDGNRGLGHLCGENARMAANALSPAIPARVTIVHTSSTRAPSCTPTPPLRTSAHKLIPPSSICPKQNAFAPVRTPYACVSTPSDVAAYQGKTRSAAQPRHSNRRTPAPMRHPQSGAFHRADHSSADVHV